MNYRNYFILSLFFVGYCNDTFVSDVLPSRGLPREAQPLAASPSRKRLREAQPLNVNVSVQRRRSDNPVQPVATIQQGKENILIL